MGKAMRAFLGALAFAASLAVVSVCSAATIEPVQGQLSINQGQGFHPVNGRIDANVGDLVMVSPGGSATVSYPDGCKVPVQPGAVMTILPLSPCASGSYVQDRNTMYGNLAFGAAAAGAAGFLGYEIYQSWKTPLPPVSP
jgi:hypothetical protein